MRINMRTKQRKRASKKSSAFRPLRVTHRYRTKFVAHGDLLGRDFRIPIKIALPAGDWCLGLLQVTPLSAFGDSIFRHFSRHDVLALYVAGCDINARVATTGNKTGPISIYAEDLLRGLARPAFAEEDFGDHGMQDAKRKKARRNG
jgi:hypothetical protein